MAVHTFVFTMNDLIQNILPSVVSLVVGGGLTAIITSRSIRQKAKADAMMSVQDVYQETISDLRQDRLSQREEFERQITELKTRIETLQAADITFSDRHRNRQLFEYIRDHLPYDQLIWEKGSSDYPLWVHVSFSRTGNRHQVLYLK